jgi:hypothetical protein
VAGTAGALFFARPLRFARPWMLRPAAIVVAVSASAALGAVVLDLV